jgi:anti-sigma regulatory factor (Ser/Thr protein kinase)
MATLSLFADLSQLGTICTFVTEIGRELGLDERSISELHLAVDEACTNVIQHAYHGRGGQIEVTVEPMEGDLQVVIRDWGQAFDPQAVPTPDPTVPLEQRPLGGLGLFLMRRVMDRIEFQFDPSNGNTLTMWRRLPDRG